jgi:pimeloyl-ACP methyl ester carboxylesterase
MGAGMDIAKHLGPRTAWERANNRALSEQSPCLRERLRQTDQTRRAIDNVAAANGTSDACAHLMVKYDGSDRWWNTLGSCRQPGGPTNRMDIFECAFAKIPAADRQSCLRPRLLETDQTRRGIDTVAASNGSPNNCDQVMVSYDGSDRWWGAFGSCKQPGGLIDRAAIFDCAFASVPASEQQACPDLKERLRQTDQTRRAIDTVAAANGRTNGCDQLVVKYDGSDWWWGAFGGCKRTGGPTDPAAIFDCAWAQVPAGDPNDLSPERAGVRQEFFVGTWDKPVLPILVPDAQPETWTSKYYPCRQSSMATARLDRQETYDPRFLAWRWRLGAEQLLFSHQNVDPATRDFLFMANDKPMLLACGTEDDVPFNEICDATQKTAPYMTKTLGKALFLQKTGHSLDGERPTFWAQQIIEFLRLN